jgi:hypothetical protein
MRLVRVDDLEIRRKLLRTPTPLHDFRDPKPRFGLTFHQLEKLIQINLNQETHRAALRLSRLTASRFTAYGICKVHATDDRRVAAAHR